MSDLKQRCETLNIQLPEEFFEKADKFCSLLLQWNRTHNISGIKTRQACYDNIVDAIAPLAFLPPFESCADIGAGAGFPSMPLAIAKPQAHFTAIEPNAKRYAFLHYAAMRLELQNVAVEPKRAEDVAKRFDLVVSRAVAKTDVLLSLAKPLCSENASLLFYKGESVEEELVGMDGYELFQDRNRRYLLFKGFAC